MSLKMASFAALGIAAFAVPASASTHGAARMGGCPNARPQIQALGAQLKQMDGHLAMMDEALAAQKEARRAAVDEAVASIEEAVRQPGVTPAQIDAVVADAVARAELKANVGAHAADAAEAAIKAMEPQLQALEDRIGAMSEDGDLDPDPAAVTE